VPVKDKIVYAIGDVHGEAERYANLLDYIETRHAKRYSGQPSLIVQVGDLVDRGPQSYEAICLAMDLESRHAGEIIHLRGNHEQLMLDALAIGATDRTINNWLDNGGKETMASYKAAGFDRVPQAHIAWLKQLPTLHSDRDSGLIFVHAGVDVDIFPHCREAVRMWTREARFFASDTWNNDALKGWRVVHGHTPTENFMPEVDGVHGRRINIDTGAVFGGRLTAAVFAPNEDIQFVYG